MKSNPLLALALLAAVSAPAMHPADSLDDVEHPIHLELSPLSPSATRIPLPAPQNVFVSELEGLSGRAPNFFISSTSRHSFGDVYSVRGLVNAGLFTDPSLGLYVDGVPVGGSAFSYAQPLYAIDRVDLFRGPQTTLFGLNTESGLLEIHTRHADRQTWHGELSGLYGDFRTIEHRLWVGGPLIKDKLTLEIAGFEGTTQGFIDNTFLGGRRDDRETLASRAVLTWTPAQDWEITAGYDGSRSRDGSSRLSELGGDRYQVRSDVEGSLRLNQTREWLTIGHQFETWEVRSVTAHRSWEVDPLVQDLDLSPARAGSFRVPVPNSEPPGFFESLPTGGSVTRLGVHEEVWSQEFRLQSRVGADAPWWKAGLFFQRQRTTGEADHTQALRQFESQLVPLPPERFIFLLPGGRPVLGFNPPPIVIQAPNFEFRDFVLNDPLRDHTRFELREESWAGYLNAGHHWGPFAASGGLRTTYTRKSIDRDGYTSEYAFTPIDFANVDRAFEAASAASLRLAPADGPGMPIDFIPPLQQKKRPHRYSAEDDDVNLTPSVGLTLDLTKYAQLFARSSYLVKSGGFNPLVTDAGVSQYGREQIWSTEAGVRALAWQGRLQAQLTGYWNTIDDYQLDLYVAGLVINADRARARGVELEVAWQLMPGLAASANIGWNDTELTQLLPDRQAPYVPRYNAFVALDYRHRCGFGGHLEFKATGHTEYLNSARQDSYGEMNARIGYEQSHYGLYLFGRNLTDTQRFTQKAFDAGYTGEPRILGMMAAVKF